jgi:hypothetical protein
VLLWWRIKTTANLAVTNRSRRENGGSLKADTPERENMKQQPKIPVSALRAEAQRLIAAGKCPTLPLCSKRLRLCEQNTDR